jgi:ATP-dependent DNA helicase RecG
MFRHEIDVAAVDLLKSRSESHFLDFKSCRIKPASICKTVCAFANADGGEIFIGIEDPSTGGSWAGFLDEEACNGHIQAISSIFPLSDGVRFELLSCSEALGLVLRVEVMKSAEIKRTPDAKVYIRRGAQNLPLTSESDIERLKLNKGLLTYEDYLVNTGPEDLFSSNAYNRFVSAVVPVSEPAIWLGKQRLIKDGKPSVAGVLLFSDEPQVDIPKAAVKIYRYRSSESEGSRATLESDPVAVEGCVGTSDQRVRLRRNGRQTV